MGITSSSNSWTCPNCTIENERESTFCVMCLAPHSWACSNCTYRNKIEILTCEMCQSSHSEEMKDVSASCTTNELCCRLASSDLQIQHVKGDGNCFYRAIAVQLECTRKDQDNYQMVRDEMCRWMLLNRDAMMANELFANHLIAEGMSFDEYVQFCKTSTNYVQSNFESICVAQAFGIYLLVHTETCPNPYEFVGQPISPFDLTTPDPRSPCVQVALFQGSEHYEAVIPVAGRAASPSAQRTLLPFEATWPCRICTFLNDTDRTFCLLCNNNR